MPDDDPNLNIRATLDASGVVVGGERASEAITGFIGPLTEAQAAAAKFGVSVEIAQAALDKNKALQKAAEVSALAASMRNAASANQEVAAASEQAANAEDDQAESVKRLQALMNEHQAQLMRSVTYIHRFADGLLDIGRGGRAASQGVMDISESLQYMLPASAAIYVVIGQVVAVLAAMALHHHRAAGEAKDHADAEKAAANDTLDAWTAANDGLKAKLEEISKMRFWAEAYDGAKQVTDEITRQASALDTVETAQEKLTKAIQDQAIARLNLAEQEALKGKEGPEAEAIKADYATRREEAKTTDEQKLKDLEIKRLNDEKNALIAERDAKQKEAHAAVADASRAYTAAEDQRKLFIDQIASTPGTGSDALGKSDYDYARDRISELTEKQQREGTAPYPGSTDKLPNITPAELVELDTLRQEVDALRAKEAQSGPSFDEQYERAKKERDAIEKASEAATQPGATLSVGGKQLTQEEAEAQIQQWADRAKALADYMAQIEQYRNLQKQIDEADDARAKAYQDAQKTKDELAAKIQAKGLEVQAAAAEKGTAGIQGQADADAIANQEAARQLAEKKKLVEEWQKSNTENFNKGRKAVEDQGEAPLEQKLEADRDALESYSENVRQIADHAKEMGALGKKHADQTAQLAAEMKAQLDELRAAVAHDEQALRDFKQSQKTNALN